MSDEKDLEKCPECQSAMSKIGMLIHDPNDLRYAEYCNNPDCGFKRTVPIEFTCVVKSD